MIEKSDIISATKANRLYWLGRYEERVYLTLHLLNKCYDKMIDGDPADLKSFRERLDVGEKYKTQEAFTLGMLYDEENPSSVISALRYSMDNAMMLREDIMSETLSYIEMSVATMRRCKAQHAGNEAALKELPYGIALSDLQQLIDWSLAFWGSTGQRVLNNKALCIMRIGRNVEYMDMLLRFEYPFHRVEIAYDSLRRYCFQMRDALDEHICAQLDALILEDLYDPKNETYKYKLIKFINQLVRI